MPKIYLINVGANTRHQSKARSPLFPDGSFIYVSFPDKDWPTPYPATMKRFVRDAGELTTHLDPDWEHLTYGDNCSNRRARALLKVQENDILLFWGLLWKIQNEDHDVFAADDDARRWCLIGALRVAPRPLKQGESITRLPAAQQEHAKHNAHVQGDRVEVRKDEKGKVEEIRVFIGNRKHSTEFGRAVDLQINQKDSLLLKTVLTADGRKLEWDSKPRWHSVVRSCRALLDLSIPENRKRAELLRRAIKKLNPNFDLLA